MSNNRSKFIVKPQTLDQSIKTIVEAIDKGYELQNKEGTGELTVEERLEYNDSIILQPFYQREYRATIDDESSLIESILVGIPIPPVFLTSTRYRGVQVLDVVDGQHRLKAFYRFRKGQYALNNLPLLEEYDGKHFTDLPIEAQEDLISHKLPAYVFRNFPGKKFELEVFNRYNKGTKALTQQEIRNAVYSSPFNDYVNEFAKLLMNGQDVVLKNAYNVTKDRYLKKKVQEGIFTILWVLEFGINTNFKDSTTYANEYMKIKAENYENDSDIANENLHKVKDIFYEFNEWIRKCTRYTPYPFSKEIYGISSKSYKFQTSMALILPAIYKKEYIDNNCKKTFEEQLKKIQAALSSSFLEDTSYNASSTNSTKINELISSY